jgi:hypothetical protein
MDQGFAACQSSWFLDVRFGRTGRTWGNGRAYTGVYYVRGGVTQGFQLAIVCHGFLVHSFAAFARYAKDYYFIRHSRKSRTDPFPSQHASTGNVPYIPIPPNRQPIKYERTHIDAKRC